MLNKFLLLFVHAAHILTEVKLSQFCWLVKAISCC